MMGASPRVHPPHRAQAEARPRKASSRTPVGSSPPRARVAASGNVAACSAAWSCATAQARGLRLAAATREAKASRRPAVRSVPKCFLPSIARHKSRVSPPLQRGKVEAHNPLTPGARTAFAPTARLYPDRGESLGLTASAAPASLRPAGGGPVSAAARVPFPQSQELTA